jgi:hypothetical protein
MVVDWVLEILLFDLKLRAKIKSLVDFMTIYKFSMFSWPVLIKQGYTLTIEIGLAVLVFPLGSVAQGQLVNEERVCSSITVS